MNKNAQVDKACSSSLSLYWQIRETFHKQLNTCVKYLWKIFVICIRAIKLMIQIIQSNCTWNYKQSGVSDIFSKQIWCKKLFIISIHIKNCFQICTDCKSIGNDFLKYNISMTAPVNATNTISFLSSWARIFTTSQAPLVNSTGSVFPWNYKNQIFKFGVQ